MIFVPPLTCTCDRPRREGTGLHYPECDAACGIFKVFGVAGMEASPSCTLIGVTGVPFATGVPMPELGIDVKRFTARDAVAAVLEAQGFHASVSQLVCRSRDEKRGLRATYQVGEHGRIYRTVFRPA